ncbi:MAG: dockerin type I repeat-containing protein, partial [Clostridia bacterium]|nr:dockerin type I repeat-containing protein [Clostridia bacterium]
TVDTPADVVGYSYTVEGSLTGTMGDEDVTITVTYSPNEYALNITYVMSDGNDTVKPDDVVNQMVTYNTEYNVPSPTVPGYEPDIAFVSGTMDENGYSATVTYYPVNAALTIYYVIEGTDTLVPGITPNPYTDDVQVGDTYSVTSPVIDHYTALTAVVEGEMVEGLQPITVEYRPETITITYKDLDGTGSIQGLYGTAIDAADVPTPAEDAHNTFLGWYVEGDASQTIVDFPTKYEENATYVAKYQVSYPKLIARDDSVTTVDRDRHIVYGFADEDGDVYVTEEKLKNIFLDVEGNGYMVITPAYTFNGKGLYGTGAIVTVYDNYDDQPVAGETFTVIVFGDINGDGRVTSTDTTAIRNEVAWVTAWSDPGEDEYNYYKTLAADVNRSGSLDGTDTTAIRNHVACLEYIEQNQSPVL